MRFEQHCQRCLKVFGQPFAHVHLWLDEFHGQAHCKTKHRRFRHHWAGIELIRKQWGDMAAEAAVLHIVDDLKVLEDPSANESWIAKDEADYLKKGYW